MRLLLLLLMVPLMACPPTRSSGDDDDDATADDDDATADDDDDSIADDDDDSIADDDDDVSTEGCPPLIQEALWDIENWNIAWSCGAASFASGLDDQTVRFAARFQLEEVTEESLGRNFALYAKQIAAKDRVPGTLELQSGFDLFAYDCNDAIYVEPEVVYDLEPIDGSLTLTITEFNDEWWWTGDVSARGLSFADAQGNVCEMPDTTWEGLGFGWLPG